jgi:hypothetical protein
MEHAGVLHADEGAEDAEHPGRHAEVEADTVGVPGARAGAGANDHLVVGKILDQLIKEREHRGAAAVDEALAPDLDHICLRKDGQDWLGFRLRKQHLVGQ